MRDSYEQDVNKFLLEVKKLCLKVIEFLNW